MLKKSVRRWLSGLSKIVPRSADDEEAQLAPFTDSGVAARISTSSIKALASPAHAT